MRRIHSVAGQSALAQNPPSTAVIEIDDNKGRPNIRTTFLIVRFRKRVRGLNTRVTIVVYGLWDGECNGMHRPHGALWAGDGYIVAEGRRTWDCLKVTGHQTPEGKFQLIPNSNPTWGARQTVGGQRGFLQNCCTGTQYGKW